MPLWGRILNVIALPGEVFDSIRSARTSTANWLVPILVLSLAGTLSALLIFSQPTVVQQIREQQTKQIEQRVASGKMTQQDADQSQQLFEKYGTLLLKASGIAGAVFMAFAGVFWWAFLLWLIARLFLRLNVPFGKSLEVAGLASVISSLEVVIRTLLILASHNPAASLSLGMLVKHPDPGDRGFMLLSLVNLMTFWVLIVRAIGLGRMAGIPFFRTALWVFVVWGATMFAMVGLSSALQSAAAP